MAFTANQVNDVFKFLGKLFKAADVAQASSDEIKKVTMATVRQVVTGQSSEFDEFNSVLTPMNSNCKSAASALDKLYTQMQALADAYLANVVSVAIGAAEATSASALDALRSSMLTNSQYLASGGTLISHLNDFFKYTDMPITGTTVVPDSWISDSVI